MPKLKDSTRYGKNYIYFIYEGEPNQADSVDIFKMGFSADPRKRLSSLQTGNRRQLSIYRVIECPDRKWAKALEYVLHKNYLTYNNRGEWFHIHTYEINFICATVIDLLSSGLPLEHFEDIPFKDLIKAGQQGVPMTINYSAQNENTQNYDIVVSETKDGVERTACIGLPDGTNFTELTSVLRANFSTTVSYTRENNINIIWVEGNHEEALNTHLPLFLSNI